MNVHPTLRARLRQQHLASQKFTRPDQVVAWLGAVQAQDFTSAKWGLGQRLRGATDAAIERAFSEGSLLRTHVMRPTWHFVTPRDIRWMLALSAPRLRRVSAYNLRLHGVDETMRRRGFAAIERALGGGRHLTRVELAAVLERAGVATTERLRTNHLLGHILGWAELEGLVCSGPRRGKQFTYALLDERVPPAADMDRDEAVAELARRYFTSHGPATLRDFAWWSGLTLADARLGVELSKGSLACEERDGQHYWRAARLVPARGDGPRAHLLPNYDEYTVSYADRSVLVHESFAGRSPARMSVLIAHTIVVDGQVVGTWTRTYGATTVTVTLQPARPLARTERHAVDAALERFRRFVAPMEMKTVRA